MVRGRREKLLGQSPWTGQRRPPSQRMGGGWPSAHRWVLCNRRRNGGHRRTDAARRGGGGGRCWTGLFTVPVLSVKSEARSRAEGEGGGAVLEVFEETTLPGLLWGFPERTQHSTWPVGKAYRPKWIPLLSLWSLFRAIFFWTLHIWFLLL